MSLVFVCIRQYKGRTGRRSPPEAKPRPSLSVSATPAHTAHNHCVIPVRHVSHAHGCSQSRMLRDTRHACAYYALPALLANSRPASTPMTDCRKPRPKDVTCAHSHSHRPASPWLSSALPRLAPPTGPTHRPPISPWGKGAALRVTVHAHGLGAPRAAIHAGETARRGGGAGGRRERRGRAGGLRRPREKGRGRLGT